VLSRVTLGADVAITSVMLDGLKRRFRQATIWLCGDRKSYQLFEADSRVGYYPIFYERGASLDRVLAERAFFKTGIVVDPDSRISQLGLLPICPEENYYFFESRAYGGDSRDTLSHLAARWMRETFGVDAKPYIAPRTTKWSSRYLAVSLGVGGNANKRLSPEFERRWIEKISQQGLPVVVDRGAGGEEAERVENAVRGIANINTHKGSFAEFADVISQSVGYYGYDSAGTHVAAVCGIPLTAVFKGHVNERMFERWKPTGAGNSTIIRIDDEPYDLDNVFKALDGK
jgi:ADP-heptose:LPS heptosyltransferase